MQIQTANIIRGFSTCGFDYLWSRKQRKTVNNKGKHSFSLQVRLKLIVMVFPDFKSHMNVSPINSVRNLGWNSQNFLPKFLRFFLTLKCYYGLVIHRK
jgi:hypothetical protein